jgi:hypothetical protein
VAVTAAIAAAVQRNCDLADARHARDSSLCTYLLAMREYFRWSQALALGTMPARAALSDWIAARESLWESLRDAGDGYAPLPLDAGVDAFDTEGANRCLRAHGLVYGAGVGLYGAPQFFLARRHSEQMRDRAQVLIADQELARGIAAAPAAARGATIFVRRDALRRWLWTRIETVRRTSVDHALIAALRCHGDPDDPGPAVAAMVESETETLILHELGELRAGRRLAGWEQMLAEVEDRRTEVLLRALRDLCADCLVTLPALLAREARGSLLLWFANFDGLRRTLAPELAGALDAATMRIDHTALERAAADGSRRWLDSAHELLACWRAGGREALVAQAARLVAPA